MARAQPAPQSGKKEDIAGPRRVRAGFIRTAPLRPSPYTDVSDPDPQAGAVANGYASALVEACADAKALDSVHGDIETITAYMAANLPEHLPGQPHHGAQEEEGCSPSSARRPPSTPSPPTSSTFSPTSPARQLDAIAEELRLSTATMTPR